MAAKADVYSSDSIVVLEGLEPIRRRPGMYIGDVHDGSGLHHLLWEVVGNAIDEHLAGHASRLRVSVEGPFAEVEDDGRGIPIEPCLDGRSCLDVVFTTLHAGPTADNHWPHVHVSPRGFGVGLVAVNALAEDLEVEVRRGGWSWHARYARGALVTPLERGARTDRTGTRIRFRADRRIFGTSTFDRALVRQRLVELAGFNPRLAIEFMCERLDTPRGIVRWLEREGAPRSRSPSRS